jgi:Flp pilus assembly protein TadD
MRSAISSALAFLLAFFGILATSSISGQTRTNSTGTGGMHEVRGRIYLPSGKSPDVQMEVELQSTNYSTLKLYTDGSSSYSFQNLAPGNYSVVVNAGEQFEIAREYVTIDTEVQGAVRVNPGPKHFTIPIYLQLKRVRGEPLKNEVINAKWSSVPKDAIEHYRDGLQLVRENNAEQATAEFRKAIEISESFAPAHAALGKLYLVTGKLDEALEELRTSLRYDSTDFDARLSYGIALLNKMQWDDAQKELTDAANLDKTSATPLYYLGRIFIQRKDIDAAQRVLESAKQLIGDKPFPLLHRYLGGVYIAKKLNKEAVAELEIYMRQDPKTKDADRIKQIISDLKAKQN